MLKPWLHNSWREESREAANWPGEQIPRAEWLTTWSRVAANSFGGPAGQIAVMHDEIVTRRRWVSERRFLHALNYCMLLPGPEAQQLATYLGWMLRGPGGGLFSGTVFILPGFVSIMVLSILFATYGDVGWVEGMFFGITAGVVAIVAHAVQRIGRRVITNRAMLTIAAAAFVAVFFYEIPFPSVVIGAIAIGIVGGHLAPSTYGGESRDAAGTSRSDATPVTLIDDDHPALGAPTLTRSIRVAMSGVGLWFAPLIVLVVTVGADSVFVDVGRFFSTAAVLTFGGAYSVLAYIADAAVNDYGWLQPGEMLSGLGMAETTPGPLIQVVQFVGFMGPYRSPGTLSPMTAGALGAVVASWVTFVPSLLWIFLGAPYVEQLRGRRSLTAALNTVTAAIVGVVLNLAVWFTVYTLFDEVTLRRFFGAVLHQPSLHSINWAAFSITAAALVSVFRYKVPTIRLVLASAVVGVAYQMLI